jgi:hypothetical protein
LKNGEAEIRALGKVLTLRLGMNELIEIEAALKITPQEQAEKGGFLKAFSARVDISYPDLRTVFFHGLRGGFPELTMVQAGEVVTELGIDKAGDVILAAMGWVFGKHEGTA